MQTGVEQSPSSPKSHHVGTEAVQRRRDKGRHCCSDTKEKGRASLAGSLTRRSREDGIGSVVSRLFQCGAALLGKGECSNNL